MRFAVHAALLVVASASTLAHADSLTYASPGTPATAVNLSAAASGPIMGYFVGSSAWDTDSIALYDITTNSLSSFAFNNQTTAPGASVNFGTVAAGDQLLFVMYNQSTNTYLTSSNYNYDHIAHAYITNYAGGVINSITYPTGVYVGFEDLLTSQNSDLDYNDDTFVFTNVASAPAPVPEPGTLALMGTGVLGMAGVLRRRFARS